MKVSFGLGLPALDLKQFTRLTRLADEEGFGAVTGGDNPVLMRDQYVALTLIALNTTRCRLGSTVTNPITRDPLVTASAISSIEELAPGRVFLGVGTGNKERAKLADVEGYVRAVRELWTHSSTDHRGQRFDMLCKSRSVPVFIAASGPKGLRQAGRIADGVFVGAGLLPEVIADVKEHIALGAREAGRDPSAIEVWWYVNGNLAPSKEKAVEEVLGGIATTARHAFGAGLERQRVPSTIRANIEAFMRQLHSTEVSLTGGRDRNAQLIERLGLREYLAERFSVAGTPRDWIERVRQLASLGVRNLFVGAVMPRKEEFVTLMGKEVIPHFR